MCQTPTSVCTVILITLYEIVIILSSLQMKKLKLRGGMDTTGHRKFHSGRLASEFELSLIPGRAFSPLTPDPRTKTSPTSAHPDNVVDTVDIRVTHVDADGTQGKAILLA